MANIHVLNASPGRIRLVMHVAIPNANNSAGINWRTIMVRAGRNTTVLPDGDGSGGTISAAEKTSVQSGALYEHVGDYKRVMTTNAELDAIYAKVSAEVQAGLQVEYQFYGHIR